MRREKMGSEWLESTRLCPLDGFKYFKQLHVESLPLLLTSKALLEMWEKHECPLKYSFRLSRAELQM